VGKLFEPGSSGIVDLQGRKVSDLKVKGSSLVKATQWVAFLDDWAERMRADEPWVLFALHATLNLHQAFGIMARRLRKNRWWTGGSTMAEDTVGLVADAEARLAWFEKNSEQLDKTLIPGWARFLFAAIEGAYRMLVRVARETEQVLRKGHLLVPVDTMGNVVPDDSAPGAVIGERE
jgi:hypothetical protein